MPGKEQLFPVLVQRVADTQIWYIIRVSKA